MRGRWANENSLKWVLNVTFNEDQSRLLKGSGACNMAVVRHFALNLVRTAKDKRLIKLRRKLQPGCLTIPIDCFRNRSSEIWVQGPASIDPSIDRGIA